MTVTDLARDAATDPDTSDLRSRILTIAERLFRDMGYRKTTVADIAAALRMSPGNVYRFFPSKKALNEAVAERLLRQIEAELGRIVSESGVPARERLRQFLRTTQAMSAGQFTANRRMHDMVEVAMAESWEVIRAHIDRVEDLLAALVADGVHGGEFRVADPRAAARCVQTAIVRFCHPALIAQCAEREQPTIDEMTDFLLTALRAA
ncbi:TetR family transcriptional regulator [Methylobacterium durans]|uniref:TetR family transcriptional regulator n=1 Tax=Methylobacterium durans TaxID=2202825 RepID=UPI002AFEEE8A|nr:TetR family transcriptional regulator [Methylobacterium durans]MEA1831513.1 TetR family transcriptional regulator [Methylobacterium durans]